MNRPSRPLVGTRVVVTRAAQQATSLVNALQCAGADVALLPLLEVVPSADPSPLERALLRLDHGDWLAFTSANAVAHAWPTRGFAGTEGPRVAVVGPATAHAVRERGGTVTFEATRHDGRGLAEALIDALLDAPANDHPRVLVPQAADARPELVDTLRAAGVTVETVVAYDKRLPATALPDAERLFARSPLGWATFASPRTVEHFVTVLSEPTLGPAWPSRRDELRAAAIGPTTARALRHHGVEPVTAPEPTPAGLVTAIVEAADR